MFAMSESTLKFGPEWLRALSQGTSMSSPPPSPGLPKFKLAEHRYGREEMLAYFPKDIKMPPDLKQFAGLHKEQCQPPVTLLAMTEDEQRIWSRSVNSDAVLRLMGKGPSGPSGVTAPRGGRGGSIDRGRGRGRATYHQRGHSLDDGGEIPLPGAFTRQLSYERGNGLADRVGLWDERDRRYDKGHSGGREEDSWRKDWRSGTQRDRERDAEDDGGWRGTGSRTEKWGRSSWKGDRGEWDHGDKNSEWSHNTKIPHRKGLCFNKWEDDVGTGDDLPEWSTEDNKDSESVGTFDATGAFMEAKVDGCKPPDGEGDELPENDYQKRPSSSPEKSEASSSCSSPSPVCAGETEQQANVERKTDCLSSDSHSNTSLVKPPEPKSLDVIERKTESPPVLQETIKEVETPAVHPSSTVSPKDSTTVTKKEEVNFDHLEKAAENLVDTWTAEEDEKVEANHITSPLNSQWFYRDPQGFVQGPFSSSEMAEWFRTGYFNMTLMIRKGSEGPFCRLGDMVKQLGYVPFLANSSPVAPSPSLPSQPVVPVTSVLNGILGPPPLSLVPPQADIQSERDQRLRLLQQHLLQQQLLQQHFLQQQQQQQLYIRQQLQQVLGSIKPDTVQQEQLQQQQQPQHYVLQRLPSQRQQRHPPGVLSRPPVENCTQSDPLQQFLARFGSTHTPSMKEDTQSLWSMPGGAGGQQDVIPNWPLPNQSGSVWDIDSVNTPSTRDMMMGIGHLLPNPLVKQDALLEEQQQKTRLNEEELLLKLQEEDQQRRRLMKEEEEERERERQMREELQRREEEEMRKREELLIKQRELEERRQKEAQEQRRKEEELRRKQEEERRIQEEREKEERRKQEEKRQEEERLRKQQEAIRLQEEQKKLEELRKQEEERRRLEEEEAAAEKEKEMQRHLELQKQHQEALKRLQEKQKPKSQAPAWGGQASKLVENSSLADIQRMQEEKEKREKLEWQQQQQQQQQALLKQAQQQQAAQQAKSANLTWANRSSCGSNGPVKSLREIQQEEAEKLVLQQKELQARKQHQPVNNVSLASSSVWNNAANHLRLNASSVSYPWNVENSANNSHGSGFWEDSSPAPNSNKSPSSQSNKHQEQRHPNSASATTSNGQVNKSRSGRAKKEEETVKKLFEVRALNVDEFTQWCTETLLSMQSTIDIPTFVSFLKDVESPFEVHDYVRVYVGESKEANNFVKQFLEKRSKYKNQALKKEENMWGPAPAITPSLSKPQVGNELDGQKAPSNKKKKKNKMQKVDSAILGFTVHAAMDRINIGDIDHVEDL